MSESAGRIRLATARLASDYPLHAGVLAQWRIEILDSVQTMGVGFKDGKLRLVYNPEFVASITLDQLVGVLHHEVNHVLFEHILHEPEEDEDGTARTIAEEVTVNEWVREPLPGTPVILDQYPQLPTNEDTDARYERLRNRSGNANSASKPGSSRKSNAGGQSSSVSGAPMPDVNGAPSMNGVPTVDDHSVWAEALADPAQTKASKDLDVALVWAGLKANQRDKVGEPFAGIAAEACTETGVDSGIAVSRPGRTAGMGDESLDQGTACVPWQVLLRRYIGRLVERRPVFGRPPRRFPHMTGIIPGNGRFSSKPKIMAVIDTSGSMTKRMLFDISAELAVAAQYYEITIVECDVNIHSAYPYRPITAVHGRGGTSFRAPFEDEFLREHQPDLVLYFTDGYGEAPSKAPGMPVIWCITEGGVKPASWGEEIRLKEPENSF